MIAKVSQVKSIVTVEFENKPDETIIKGLKNIGLVQQNDLLFKGINNNEHKIIDNINALGISVTTPDGYMGGGAWYGCKSGRLYGKDLVSAIRTDLKQAKIKATVRRERCGYSSSITVTVAANENDFITKDEYVNNYEENKGYWFNIPPSMGGGDVHRDFVLWSNDKYTDEQRMAIIKYTAEQEYDYAMSRDFIDVNKYGAKKMCSVVTDEFDKKLRQVQAILHQYNYDESNSMVDYFSVGFYDDVVIKNPMKKIKKSA